MTKTTKATAKKPAAKRSAKVQHKGLIAVYNTTTDQNHIYVQADDGRSFTRSRRGDSKEFRAVSQIGMSFDAALKFHNANPAPKPTARLANGIAAKDAPQSAKAVADQAKASPPKAGKAKAAAPKTGKADKNKQPSNGKVRTYKKGDRKNEARADTWRFYMLETIMGAKDTDAAKAAHAKSGKFSDNKLDFKWADQQGYISFTN